MLNDSKLKDYEKDFYVYVFVLAGNCGNSSARGSN